MKYGFSHLFFGHKLRVTRRHQSRGRSPGSVGSSGNVRASRPFSTTSDVNKTCTRCGGWYLKGVYAAHVKTPGHVSALSRPAGSQHGTAPSAGSDPVAGLLAENERSLDWLMSTKLTDLGSDLERLIGGANFDMAYRGESRQISFTPPLDDLARLGLEAQTRAANLAAHPAPNASLDCVRTSAIEMLEAIADFHAWQVRMLGRFTPDNVEDGSYKALSAEFGASLQPKIDALTPHVAQFNGVLTAFRAGLDDRARPFRASAAPRK
jgi:hypothetical protein